MAVSAAAAVAAAAGAAITTTTATPFAVPGWLACSLSRPESCRIYNTRRRPREGSAARPTTDCRKSEGGREGGREWVSFTTPPPPPPREG